MKRIETLSHGESPETKSTTSNPVEIEAVICHGSPVPNTRPTASVATLSLAMVN
ncbi:hypothetical protein [Singulisphaera sp. PoT]|uniref:hypothetical protein n=1 Tax=Singulisphaera sp. PoT TaxID=3411797 RepID=UPI003BF4B2F8